MGKLTKDSDRHEVAQVLNTCIEKLFGQDLCLLTEDVNERSITHKLAEYLQLETDLNVDCEYNRNFELGRYAQKRLRELTDDVEKRLRQGKITLEELPANSTYPDIIIHRRLENTQNLLVVEVKKSTSKLPCRHDFAKLSGFTHHEANDYHYHFGVFLKFETRIEQPTKPEPIWFIDGQEVDR